MRRAIVGTSWARGAYSWHMGSARAVGTTKTACPPAYYVSCTHTTTTPLVPFQDPRIFEYRAQWRPLRGHTRPYPTDLAPIRRGPTV